MASVSAAIGGSASPPVSLTAAIPSASPMREREQRHRAEDRAQVGRVLERAGGQRRSRRQPLRQRDTDGIDGARPGPAPRARAVAGGDRREPAAQALEVHALVREVRLRLRRSGACARSAAAAAAATAPTAPAAAATGGQRDAPAAGAELQQGERRAHRRDGLLGIGPRVVRGQPCRPPDSPPVCCGARRAAGGVPAATLSEGSSAAGGGGGASSAGAGGAGLGGRGGLGAGGCRGARRRRAACAGRGRLGRRAAGGADESPVGSGATTEYSTWRVAVLPTASDVLTSKEKLPSALVSSVAPSSAVPRRA